MIVTLFVPVASFAIQPPPHSAMRSQWSGTFDSYYGVGGGVHWGNLLDVIFAEATRAGDFSLIEYRYYYVLPLDRHDFSAIGSYNRYLVFLTDTPILDLLFPAVQAYGSYTIASDLNGFYVGGAYSELIDREFVAHLNSSAIFSFFLGVNVSDDVATFSYNAYSQYGDVFDYLRSDAVSSGTLALLETILFGSYYDPQTDSIRSVSYASPSDMAYFGPKSNPARAFVSNDGSSSYGTYSIETEVGDDHASWSTAVFGDYPLPYYCVAKDSFAWAEYVYKFYNPSEHEGTLLNQALALIMEQFEVNGQNSQISGLYDTYMDTYGEAIEDSLIDGTTDVENSLAEMDVALEDSGFFIDWFFNSGAMSWLLWLIPFGVLLTVVKIMLQRG